MELRGLMIKNEEGELSDRHEQKIVRVHLLQQGIIVSHYQVSLPHLFKFVTKIVKSSRVYLVSYYGNKRDDDTCVGDEALSLRTNDYTSSGCR
jgi:hypothetical protein